MRGDSRGEGSRWGSREFFLKKRESFFAFHLPVGVGGFRGKKMEKYCSILTKRLRLYLSTTLSLHPMLELAARSCLTIPHLPPTEAVFLGSIRKRYPTTPANRVEDTEQIKAEIAVDDGHFFNLVGLLLLGTPMSGGDETVVIRIVRITKVSEGDIGDA